MAEPSQVVGEPGTPGNYMHENRETSASAAKSSPAQEEPNKGRPSRPAEALEGRADAKENRGKPYTDPTQSGKDVSPGLAFVRQRERERKTEKFTNLLHHVRVELLRESYYALQRKSAAGIDGVTWTEYGTGLESRLADLHSHVHRDGSTYRNRTADSGRSGSRRWRTRSSSKPWSPS